MKGRSEVKRMAKIAKARLKSGFWETQKVVIGQKTGTGDEAVFVDDVMREYCKANYVVKRSKTRDELIDESIYETVCQIIDEDDGLNPLGRLINRQHYNTLGDAERQNYVFDLSERYNRLSQRYLHECEVERRLTHVLRA